MISSKDMFMEQREEEMFEERESYEATRPEDLYGQHHDEMPLPVLDMNFIEPNNDQVDVMMGDKIEKMNVTSFDISERIIQAIEEGKINPMEFAVKKKLISDAFDIAWKNEKVRKKMIDEVESRKGEATCMGAVLKITKTPKYLYEHDSKWKSLNDSIQPVVIEMKEQEKRVQAACKNGGSIVDSDTGEVVASIVPHPTTESVSVSFKTKKKK